ncbi:hypothetical protein SK61_04612 [Enterobacter sp. BIDMC100]|nr:hypothetical protein SK61_04612 [Enterobacter sp. BIDMC100]
MEVLDLVTDNKGISVMSSMSNSSASSEIDDAKRAVKAFANALGDHRDIVGSLHHSMATEFIDLGMDFAGLNDGFDFGSVFSLFSLSSVKWFTEFGHLNRGDMLTSEQHRCHNEKKKFQRRV